MRRSKVFISPPRRIPRFIRRYKLIFLGIFILLLFTRLTNPFVGGNIVKEPFSTTIDANGDIVLSRENTLILRGKRYYKNLALIKSTTHIIANVYSGSKKTKSKELEGIIDEIHALRFNLKYPYLISGDHFSVFYPRSLGIFYASALDPRTARSAEDWANRQEMILKSTAFALEAYKNAPALSTTIVPIGSRAVTLVNIYAYPSDTLYSLLYALDVMQDDLAIFSLYPSTLPSPTRLHTQKEATRLLQEHQESLKKHLALYLQTVMDPKTGLVKKDLLLSGTKDVTKRESAFYDNVILWKTQQLAQKLGLQPTNPQYLSDLKQHIINNFWSEEQGIFVEDLSSESLAHKYYSSEWLIVLMTGFLNPANPAEQVYYTRSLDYIHQHSLQLPLGLKFSPENRLHLLYLWPRIGAPSYGGTAIWSNWGMEYVKLLILLYNTTKNNQYVEEAQRQIEAYEQRMVQYQGYPEVYDDQGKMYSNFLYKSVRQTGWVVSFEQARLLLEDAKEKKE